MMSHAINEGIIKLVAEKNTIKNKKHEALIKIFLEKEIISKCCAEASKRIWKSYRNDIHHMNPKVAKIDFKEMAKNNIQDLAIIEKEIFGYNVNDGKIIPHHPKYWDIDADVAVTTYLRFE